jgi:cobalamin biosynthesis Mg chelatase CobN
VTSGLPSGIETPSAPQPTAAPGYSFTGWYPAVNTTVTGDVTYTAQWTQLPSSTPVQPQVIIRPAVPGADTYVTVTPPTPQVPEAQGQGSTTAQDSSAGSGTGAGAGSGSGSGSTTGLSDDKTPLSDGSTESTAAPATDVGLLLLLLFILLVIVIVGWLFLKYAKY